MPCHEHVPACIPFFSVPFPVTLKNQSFTGLNDNSPIIRISWMVSLTMLLKSVWFQSFI